MSPPKAKPASARFWSKVDIRGHDECWEWTASRGSHGYGAIGLTATEVGLAHRVSWEIHNGPIPEGLFVLHHCDNRGCVNPAHLFLGDVQANATDMVQKGRSTHGSRNPQAKLTEEAVVEIRSAYADGGVLHRELAERYGVSRTAITNVLSGKVWRCPRL